jgi:hypothetical protein
MPTPRVMARLYADAGCIRPKSASLEELPMGSDRREQRRGVSPTQFRRVLAYADETEHHTKSGQLGANAIRHETWYVEHGAMAHGVECPVPWRLYVSHVFCVMTTFVSPSVSS